MAAPSARLAAAAQRPLQLGVNLAGAEFASIGGKWKWPSVENARYHLDSGIRTFRMPFSWKRLQPEFGKPLDEGALAGLDTLVDVLTSAKGVVMLDAHNYGRRDKSIIGDTDGMVSIDAFADFWKRMARRYGNNRHVWYGLMNEPHDQPLDLNVQAQNAACAAIRSTGSSSKVLFSGTAWTGAHAWIKSGNGNAMLAAHDSANNYAFDMHQYLDKGFGGSSAIAIPGVGARILQAAYDWGRKNDKKIFIGEFGSGPDEASLKELRDLLTFMDQRRDVFIGGTYWAGGGVWGKKNMKSADPINGEKPQITLMRSFL